LYIYLWVQVSERTQPVADKSYTMEAHFVHADKNGHPAVTGLIYTTRDRKTVVLPESGKKYRQTLAQAMPWIIWYRQTKITTDLTAF